MHILTLGTKKDLMSSVLKIADRVTVLYEGWEELRIAPYRQIVNHWAAIESYQSIELLLSGLYHTNAINFPIDAIVPAHETAVVPAAILGKLLNARAIPVNVAMRCRDKALQKASWQKNGLVTARYVVINDALAQNKQIEEIVSNAKICAPYVIKPLSFHSSRNVYIVTDPTKLASTCLEIVEKEPAMRCLMIEQFINGEEWHLDGVVYKGIVRALTVSKYMQPVIENRQGKPLASVTYRTEAHPELYKAGYDLAQKAVNSIGLKNSVFHLEAFMSKGEYQFAASELAARTAGGYTIQVLNNMFNLDLWDAHLKTTIGIAPTIPNMIVDNSWGYTYLASQGGKKNYLQVKDIANIPGVVEADVSYPYKSVMPNMIGNSSVTLGYAIVQGKSEAECEQSVLKVQKRVSEIHNQHQN